MFLFSWLFGLIGLALSLLLLPLRFIGLPLAVILLPFRMILRFIARHTTWAIVIVLIGLFILHLSHSKNDKLPELTPAPGQRAQKGIPIIQPVLKREDGDSNFATDLYALMTEEERIAYSQNFYGAMNTLSNGQIHNWSSYNINGSLRVDDTFANNSGVTCHHFSEGLKVHTIQQTITGTACSQGGGTWCKLKQNATPACGLSGNSGGFFDGITSSIKNLF